MVVYVDDMYKNPMGQFRRMKMSHLVASDITELHAFARKIGMRRSWFQGDHYDVSMGYRRRAIQAGAIEVTMRQLAGIRWCLDRYIDFYTPDHAVEIMLNMVRSRGKSKLGEAVRAWHEEWIRVNEAGKAGKHRSDASSSGVGQRADGAKRIHSRKRGVAKQPDQEGSSRRRDT